jgi:tetratricopeptide (TPR) repeat protein
LSRELAESTRRKLITYSASRYEDEFVQKVDDPKAQQGAGDMATWAAGNHFILGEYEEANEWYLKAAEAYIRAAELHPMWDTDVTGRVQAELRIGQCLWRAGRREESIPHLTSVASISTQTLSEAQEQQNRRVISASLISLIYAYMYLGSYKKALPFAKRYVDSMRRKYQAIRKMKNLPKLSPSQTWLLDSCKALVDMDKESFTRARNGLAFHIRVHLTMKNPRGFESDFLIMLDEGEDRDQN